MTWRAAEFFSFMIKREKLRLAKAGGLPPPWTEDPILREYKFTNVKRYHDRTSALLIKEFYRPYRDDDPRLVLLNAGVARFFGTIEFMRAVGWQTSWEPAKLIKIAQERMSKGERVWTGAYIVRGVEGGPKAVTVVRRNLSELWSHASNVVNIARGTKRWQPTVEYMTKLYGFGSFMSKEVILDVRYTNAFWARGLPRDVNAWTPVGPGSRRGAARIQGYGRERGVPLSGGLSEKNTLAMCLQLFGAVKQFWPLDFVELELHDIQFQLCEFDKYERCRLDQGRPKAKYHPGGGN